MATTPAPAPFVIKAPVVGPSTVKAPQPISIVGLGTASVANATDAATVITQLNALLAVLRTAKVIV